MGSFVHYLSSTQIRQSHLTGDISSQRLHGANMHLNSLEPLCSIHGASCLLLCWRASRHDFPSFSDQLCSSSSAWRWCDYVWLFNSILIMLPSASELFWPHTLAPVLNLTWRPVWQAYFIYMENVHLFSVTFCNFSVVFGKPDVALLKCICIYTNLPCKPFNCCSERRV